MRIMHLIGRTERQFPSRRLICNVPPQTQQKDDILNPKRVFGVFKTAAPKYDATTDLTMFGLLPVWREKLIQRLDFSHNTRLVDVAGGTGGVAVRFLDHVKKHRLENCHITVCDINKHMMEIGKRNLSGYDPSLLTWTEADFQALPFADESFDAYTVSFGYRYSRDINQALREAYRVLRPGGQFACLEFGKVHSSVPKWFIGLHFDRILPFIGRVKDVTELMEFFLETVRRFPDQQTLSGMIRTAGFEDVSYTNCHWGLIAVHYGIKK